MEERIRNLNSTTFCAGCCECKLRYLTSPFTPWTQLSIIISIPTTGSLNFRHLILRHIAQVPSCILPSQYSCYLVVFWKVQWWYQSSLITETEERHGFCNLSQNPVVTSWSTFLTVVLFGLENNIKIYALMLYWLYSEYFDMYRLFWVNSDNSNLSQGCSA